jgi:hypothetical protein
MYAKDKAVKKFRLPDNKHFPRQKKRADDGVPSMSASRIFGIMR